MYYIMHTQSCTLTRTRTLSCTLLRTSLTSDRIRRENRNAIFLCEAPHLAIFACPTSIPSATSMKLTFEVSVRMHRGAAAFAPFVRASITVAPFVASRQESVGCTPFGFSDKHLLQLIEGGFA